MAKSVIVIGGGVIGLACGYALTEAGCDVTVVDAGELAGGASRGNAGWVTPSLATPLAAPGILATGLRSALDPRGALVIRPSLDTGWLRWLWSFKRAARPEQFSAGVKALLGMTRHTLTELDGYRAAGLEFEMHRDGIIAVARDRSAFHWFDDTFAELGRHGFEGELVHLSGDEARALEPALGDAVGAGTRMTIDRHVDPASLVRALATRAGRVVEHAPVSVIGHGATGWRVRAGGESLAAEAVVVATGTAAPGLLAPFGVELPIVGAKGYSITARGTGTAPTSALYLCEPKLGLSALDAGIRIAGMFELGRTDDAVPPGRIRQLVDDTLPYLRDWRPEPGWEATGWAGFRPATPDSLPVIGEVPSHPGLFVAAGHGMLGVTLGPATGRAVAELVSGGGVPDWVAPFAVDRAF
jgi:D-amino-acid dehydrogenase